MSIGVLTLSPSSGHRDLSISQKRASDRVSTSFQRPHVSITYPSYLQLEKWGAADLTRARLSKTVSSDLHTLDLSQGLDGSIQGKPVIEEEVLSSVR